MWQCDILMCIHIYTILDLCDVLNFAFSLATFIFVSKWTKRKAEA